MFTKPDPFEHDGDTWREQARGFDRAAGAAGTISADTNTAATEAVWKGPMPDDRLARMDGQAREANLSADVFAQMAQACRYIATEADSATTAIDDIRRDWDDGTIVERLQMSGAADDVREEFTDRTAGARSALADLATTLQPIVDAGDPLDFLFSPIQILGGPYLGERLDHDAATDYFETGELIDPQHVDEIEDTITGLSDDEDPPDDWNEWAEANGYTPAEIAAALDELDAEERDQLNAWIMLDRIWGGGKNSRTSELASFLWQNMRADQVEDFHNDVPALEPTLREPADGWVDGDVDMTVNTDMTDGGAGIDDIDQGDIGDCATLASLAASVAADPTFIDRHIQENDNGTYTVTLYDDDGNPVPVTVSGYIPADGDNPIYNGRDLDGELNWASIYEKAMAQYQGSYEAINGANTAERITETVGEDNDEITLSPFIPPDMLYDEVRDAFDNGDPIVMGGGGHAYAVVGFDDDGNILVMNPWGGDGRTVALTPEQFQSGEFPEPNDDWPEFNYVAVTE